MPLVASESRSLSRHTRSTSRLNDTWSTAAPLPTPRATLAVVTGSDGLIYAIGGFDGTNALTTVEAYAPDKCYPIEHQIALVGKQLIAAESGLAEIPPQARAGAERELAALRAQIAPWRRN